MSFIKSLLTYDLFSIFRTSQEHTPTKIPLSMRSPRYRVGKTEQDIQQGMTRDEYEDLHALCRGWLEIEQKFINENGQSIRDSAFYNIATFNLCRLQDVSSVFRCGVEQYTLNRLMQLYFNICIRFGRARVCFWSTELQKSLSEIGVDKSTIDETFRKHPYLILVPVLNYAIGVKYTLIGS